LEEAGAETEIELNHQGTLVGLLDHVALHMGLKWRYSEGRIHFYRMVNRTFVVRTMPGNMTQTGGVSVGLMTVTGNSDVNVWGGIEKNLVLLLSRHGRSHVDQSMGSVTVHDASTNVEAVDRYIDSLNRQLGRQVALHVEVLQVTLSNDHQAGIDWGWVVGLNGGNLSLTGPPSLTKDAASVGIMGTDSSNQWMVRALERFGRVSSAYASVITTMNRQAVPLGSQSTQSYLRQIGSTTITAANGTSMFGPPSLLPGEITTGFSMILLPIVLDSNHVLMHCAISISSLKGLETFSSGVGLSQQSLQQPNVAKFDTQQRMTVKSGETIVLSGYENDSTESKQTDVVRNALPGSRVNSRNKTTLVVLITPKLLDI
jgi:type IVB pilus formation R64 PilN family outer membrane protein